MGLLKNKKNGGFLDVIRCDEPSYLIWKWHPLGVELGKSERENSIRYGSSLRVKEGEVAVFVYKQKNGTMQDYIQGPYDQKIETKNLPVLSGIIGLAFEGGTPFQAEIYFINLANIVQVKFAVPFFDIYDPRFPDFGVPAAVRGTVNFKIDDYKEFIKMHRLINFSLDDFQSQIRDAVAKYVKSAVGNMPSEANIPVIQIERKTLDIADMLEEKLSERLKNDFGVKLTGLDISNIEIDKSSEGFSQLMAVTRDITTATVKAQTAANLENYAENLRIQREASQYAINKQTQSANIGAYQIEKQAEVGVAGAEAFGKMSANGAGGVDISGGGVGFNPAAMMAGMAVGGAIGQNIAGSMNNMMSGINQSMQSETTPPPISTVAYNVAVNGQPTGPFDLNVLKQMAATGRFTSESLVWKAGMQQWQKAGTIDELKEVLANIMPPIPSVE